MASHPKKAMIARYNPGMHAPVLLAAWFAGAVAVSDLTPQQKLQLDTATDFTGQFDDAALYPLLENAIWWAQGDEAGAEPADLAAIAANPAAHRGKLFVIQGKLAAPPRPVEKLLRPGPWEGTLRQYVLLVDEAKNQTVVVYLVAPPGDKERSRTGAQVRLVGRFYKIWREPNRQKKETDFPTFVGKSVRQVAAPVGKPLGGILGLLMGDTMTLLVGLGFVVLIGGTLVLWVIYRRYAHDAEDRRARREAQREERERRQAEEQAEEEAGPPLPEDPVAALAELQRRQKERAVPIDQAPRDEASRN
jgi:hypothetical protein